MAQELIFRTLTFRRTVLLRGACFGRYSTETKEGTFLYYFSMHPRPIRSRYSASKFVNLTMIERLISSCPHMKRILTRTNCIITVQLLPRRTFEYSQLLPTMRMGSLLLGICKNCVLM